MTISKAKTFRNVIYTSLTKGATLVCIAVTSSVVARNLSPSDYGVVGFAAIIIGFLAHFSDVGVGSAAIRRPTLDQSQPADCFYSENHPEFRRVCRSLSDRSVRAPLFRAPGNRQRDSYFGLELPGEHDRIHVAGDFDKGTELPGVGDSRGCERRSPGAYSRLR